jgi:hypothetical protein
MGESIENHSCFDLAQHERFSMLSTAFSRIIGFCVHFY